MPDIDQKRAQFRELHQAGCFVIPNPWDVGSARMLCHLGFPALATTSAGFAFSRGLPDGSMALEEVLGHCSEIAASVDVPVNADFENGLADSPDEVAAHVIRCVETGVAGLSIEDATGHPDRPLFDLGEAVDRLLAAREAIDDTQSGVLLTARAECFLTGHRDPLAETMRRLEAYKEAGADVLYAPGLPDLECIRAVVALAAPLPVNVLVSGPLGFRVEDLAEAGVRRVSTGSALARAAWGGFLRAARGIANDGRFDGFSDAEPFGELNEFFLEDSSGR
jgi:2-methylisocitrate lyase-like PEP mutase family enzyme